MRTTISSRALWSVTLTAALALSACGPPGPAEEIDLADYERDVFSQNGEDGVIEKLFEIIEPTQRYAVEFGASDGVRHSNVRNLIVNEGWSGLQIEGNPARYEKLRENYADHPQAKTLQAWIWPGNIEILFEENGVPPDLDLLVIDIDSNDYYVWKVIHNFRPKVVQIEYSSRYAPPQRAVIEYHPFNYWDGGDYAGASLQSMVELGRKKGYDLVHANGVNAFFVDGRYFDRFAIVDNSPSRYYRPAAEPLERGPTLKYEGGEIVKKWVMDR